MERSAHRFMSSNGHEKVGYSKLAGFSAINTKPYRPIGNLESVISMKRQRPSNPSNNNHHHHHNHDDSSSNHSNPFNLALVTGVGKAKNHLLHGPSHTNRVRFSNKQYGASLKPRLQQRKSDVSSLKIGSTANGGIFSFVHAPHALELADHTARHAFHVATQKYGGSSKTYHRRSTTTARNRRERQQQSSTTTTTTSTSDREHSAALEGMEHDDDRDDEDGEDEVRLKTRNEIWAETHLANVQNDAIKIKTPRKLKSRFLKVDQKFRNDVQSARVKKARNGKPSQKGTRNSAWRTKRMHKQINDEINESLAAASTTPNPEHSPNNSPSTAGSTLASTKKVSSLMSTHPLTQPLGKDLVQAISKMPTKNFQNKASPVTTAPHEDAQTNATTTENNNQQEDWPCYKCASINFPFRNTCYKCGVSRRNGQIHPPVRPSQQSPHRTQSSGLTSKRARRRSSVSRLQLAHSIFQEELPTGLKDDSSEGDEMVDYNEEDYSSASTKSKKKSKSPSRSSPSSKIPSYVSNKMSKHVGGGLAGLNVAYAQAQDPLFWEHYTREVAGAVRQSSPKNDSPLQRGRKSKQKSLHEIDTTGRSGDRLVGKEMDYSKVAHRVQKSTIIRERLKNSLRGIGAWQKDLWENYQRELESRDIKRVDVLRQGTMVANAGQFLDRVLREAHSAHKAMSMVRGAANEIDKAQTKINRSRVEWYDAVEAEKPLTRPHHMMKSLLLELCHYGHTLNLEIFYHSVISTYKYCGTRACNADGPFQLLVKNIRFHLHITTGQYVIFLNANKMPVPRVLLAELQQEELDRREQEEEDVKMQAMLDHDGEMHLKTHASTKDADEKRPTGLPDVLTVQVLRARKLLPADLDGYADPLVYCWMAPMWSPEGSIPEHTQRAHTEPCPKSLDPVWDEATTELFEFQVSDEFWGLSIAVYDHDEHGDNDVMAYCRVGLNVVRSHNCKTERWFTLKYPPINLGDYDGLGSHSASHKVYFGEIKLRLEWYNKAMKEWDVAHPTVVASPSSGSEDDDDLRL